jgi:hypothetical protein
VIVCRLRDERRARKGVNRSQIVARGGERLALMTSAFDVRSPSPRQPMTTSWQPTTLVQCISVKPWLVYPGCDEPGGCHDLTLGRIYEMLGVEADGAFYRILDDSGDDFLYPASHFKAV